MGMISFSFFFSRRFFSFFPYSASTASVGCPASMHAVATACQHPSLSSQVKNAGCILRAVPGVQSSGDVGLSGQPTASGVCQPPSSPGRGAPAPHRRPHAWRSAGLPAEGPCPALAEAPARTATDFQLHSWAAWLPSEKQACNSWHLSRNTSSTQWTLWWLWAQPDHIAGRSRRTQAGKKGRPASPQYCYWQVPLQASHVTAPAALRAAAPLHVTAACSADCVSDHQSRTCLQLESRVTGRRAAAMALLRAKADLPSRPMSAGLQEQREVPCSAGL